VAQTCSYIINIALYLSPLSVIEDIKVNLDGNGKNFGNVYLTMFKL